MNYMKIVPCDIANGPGVRVTLFCTGCNHHCPGCHNPQTWNPDTGKPFTEETMNELIELLRPDYIQGLTLTGGDPLYPENREVIFRIVKRVEREFGNKKDIWMWTGYTWEELIDPKEPYLHPMMILCKVKVLVDGPYIESKRDISLPYMGSSNQRAIDCRQTMECMKIEDLIPPVLWWTPEDKKGK